MDSCSSSSAGLTAVLYGLVAHLQNLFEKLQGPSVRLERLDGQLTFLRGALAGEAIELFAALVAAPTQIPVPIGIDQELSEGWILLPLG